MSALGTGIRGRVLAAGDRFARRLALLCVGLCALAAPASACPSCSVGQALETLFLVLLFMIIPYVIVSGVWLWIRAILAREGKTSTPR